MRERLLDAIADKLDLDRVEVRRRNLIAKHEMPYARPLDTLGTDIVLDSGDYAGLLDKALAAIEWPRLRETLAARRAAGELVGAGVALFVEKSGLGPFDQVKVGVDADGMVEVVHRLRLGRAGYGNRDRANLRRRAWRRLPQNSGYPRADRSHRVRNGRVRLSRDRHDRRSDADRGMPPSRPRRSRWPPNCCRRPPPSSTWWMARSFEPTPTAGPSIGLGAIARALSPGSTLRHGRAPGLSAEGWFHTNHMNYPYGVHIAVTRVDRDTGAVDIERYLVAYDVGKAVNPMLIEGQIVGGCAQGIGGTLFEEFLYDERGEPLSVTLADYLMPTAREMPPVEVIICEDAPSPLNPMGLKGRRRRRRECGRGGDRRSDRRRARRA